MRGGSTVISQRAVSWPGHAVAALLPAAPPQEILSAVLLRAETTCAAEEAKVAEHMMRKNAVRDAEGRLLELQQSVDAAAIRDGSLAPGLVEGGRRARLAGGHRTLTPPRQR